MTKHHQHGKWEARIGRVDGSKYLYLGTFENAEEAARAYDRAAVKFRGRKVGVLGEQSRCAAFMHKSLHVPQPFFSVAQSTNQELVAAMQSETYFSA